VVFVTACVTGCQQYGAHPECPARGAPAWSEITSPHFRVVSDLPAEESEAIARYYRGIFHMRSARMKEAADDLNAAVRLAPRDPRFRLGIVALRQHESEKAGDADGTPELLQAAAELEVIAESAYELSVVARQKGATGDLRGALAFAERAVSRAPIDPWVLDLYASVLAASGRLQQAVATQERAISFLPDDETNPEMFERLVIYRSQAQSGAVQ
jgi:tetratricopeptide (TPR) repeat protein